MDGEVDFDAFRDEDDMDVDVDLIESEDLGSRAPPSPAAPLPCRSKTWARPLVEPIDSRKAPLGMINRALYCCLVYT